ncbi:hypothetical protein N7462_004935 [Penicillium macrosclerotiorum]|uniref:uncharacterized protein n=1 Tax=Penicillium macrosclerotiorum TaxID=303699 RepID=UPI0025483296|nr:uncharacterized protein N7462_004935 [Penicillium macrosclerotiorum]KAJ5690543.1 hypothetical protein N7462_004935 [Penicillium macrosclerotiorum]
MDAAKGNDLLMDLGSPMDLDPPKRPQRSSSDEEPPKRLRASEVKKKQPVQPDLEKLRVINPRVPEDIMFLYVCMKNNGGDVVDFRAVATVFGISVKSAKQKFRKMRSLCENTTMDIADTCDPDTPIQRDSSEEGSFPSSFCD